MPLKSNFLTIYINPFTDEFSMGMQILYVATYALYQLIL